MAGRPSARGKRQAANQESSRNSPKKRGRNVNAEEIHSENTSPSDYMVDREIVLSSEEENNNEIVLSSDEPSSTLKHNQADNYSSDANEGNEKKELLEEDQEDLIPEEQEEESTNRSRRKRKSAEKATTTTAPAMRKEAEKKKVEKKVKDSADTTKIQEEILKFIIERNEPLNAIEVGLNFQTGPYAVGQSAVKKILLYLTEQNLIREKKAGITSVFLPIHTKEDNDTDTTELDAKMANLIEEKKVLEEEVSQLRQEKKELQMYPADCDLLDELESVGKELSEKKAQIKKYAANTGTIDPKEKKKLEKALEDTIALKKKVKKYFKSILAEMAEGSNMKPCAILENLGITLPEN
ncbi:hypothetical protein NEPAR04_0183 [Nematocida parisii]|nr:hypothetical protein NEPAR03_0177 [Nematocida parisii]KAI5125729.1 hypothetical protein NEPAR08_0167 [Nematocida parisii]KAI5140238.1 hypothetical protein NEPAR04_0183 [Nematocida parisii]